MPISTTPPPRFQLPDKVELVVHAGERSYPNLPWQLRGRAITDTVAGPGGDLLFVPRREVYELYLADTLVLVLDQWQLERRAEDALTPGRNVGHVVILQPPPEAAIPRLERAAAAWRLSRAMGELGSTVAGLTRWIYGRAGEAEADVASASDYELVARVPSASRPNQSYEIKRNRQTGEISCNCQGWRFKKAGKPRGCSHVNAYLARPAQYAIRGEAPPPIGGVSPSVSRSPRGAVSPSIQPSASQSGASPSDEASVSLELSRRERASVSSSPSEEPSASASEEIPEETPARRLSDDEFRQREREFLIKVWPSLDNTRNTNEWNQRVKVRRTTLRQIFGTRDGSEDDDVIGLQDLYTAIQRVQARYDRQPQPNWRDSLLALVNAAYPVSPFVRRLNQLPWPYPATSGSAMIMRESTLRTVFDTRMITAPLPRNALKLDTALEAVRYLIGQGWQLRPGWDDVTRADLSGPLPAKASWSQRLLELDWPDDQDDSMTASEIRERRLAALETVLDLRDVLDQGGLEYGPRRVRAALREDTLLAATQLLYRDLDAGQFILQNGWGDATDVELRGPASGRPLSAAEKKLLRNEQATPADLVKATAVKAKKPKPTPGPPPVRRVLDRPDVPKEKLQRRNRKLE